MSITAYPSPILTLGPTVTSSGATQDYNPQRAPSLFDLGSGLLDPRQRANYSYEPGSGVTAPTFGFLLGGSPLIDQVVGATSTNGLVATQSATDNTITINATGAAITSSVSIVRADTGATVTGLYAIDGLCGGTSNAGVRFGTDETIRIWNPASLVSRAITITSSVDDSGGAYSIYGYDVYGYPMQETITGPNNTTVTTQKAFKYIASISASGTINSTGIIMGYGNVYGFPIRVDSPAYATVWYGAGSSATLVTGSTNFTYASTRATQTSTTPDVRGLVSVTPTSTGSQRLQITVYPSVSQLSAITATNNAGLFGETQYSTQ